MQAAVLLENHRIFAQRTGKHYACPKLHGLYSTLSRTSMAPHISRGFVRVGQISKRNLVGRPLQ